MTYALSKVMKAFTAVLPVSLLASGLASGALAVVSDTSPTMTETVRTVDAVVVDPTTLGPADYAVSICAAKPAGAERDKCVVDVEASVRTTTEAGGVVDKTALCLSVGGTACATLAARSETDDLSLQGFCTKGEVSACDCLKGNADSCTIAINEVIAPEYSLDAPLVSATDPTKTATIDSSLTKMATSTTTTTTASKTTSTTTTTTTATKTALLDTTVAAPVDPRCPVGTFDGANCFVYAIPAGRTGFVYQNNLYTTPYRNNCPIGSFDGANCATNTAPPSGFTAYAGGMNVYYNSNSLTCTVGVFDGLWYGFGSISKARCRIGTAPSGSPGAFVWNNKFYYQGLVSTTAPCAAGSSYDGANCFVSAPPQGLYGVTGFVWSTNLYYSAYYPPVCPTVPAGFKRVLKNMAGPDSACGQLVATNKRIVVHVHGWSQNSNETIIGSFRKGVDNTGATEYAAWGGGGAASNSVYINWNSTKMLNATAQDGSRTALTYLSDKIDELCKPVNNPYGCHFVGHSMGGLVLSRLMDSAYARSAAWSILSVHTLNGAQGGSNLANVASAINALAWLVNPIMPKLSNFLNRFTNDAAYDLTPLLARANMASVTSSRSTVRTYPNQWEPSRGYSVYSQVCSTYWFFGWHTSCINVWNPLRAAWKGVLNLAEAGVYGFHGDVSDLVVPANSSASNFFKVWGGNCPGARFPGHTAGNGSAGCAYNNEGDHWAGYGYYSQIRGSTGS